MISDSPVYYNSEMANHYAEYRPLLHVDIIGYFFRDVAPFNRGLDIGCGVGHSSIALSNFCVDIDAIDCSQDMLEHTIPQDEIRYQLGGVNPLPFEDRIFDVVTLAGSLPYIKSQSLVDELLRVTQLRRTIMIYDFDISLAAIFEALSLEIKPTDYQYDTNFHGLITDPISLQDVLEDQLYIEVSAANLVHLLLSTHEGIIAAKYKYDIDSTDALVAIVKDKIGDITQLAVKRYAALYRHA